MEFIKGPWYLYILSQVLTWLQELRREGRVHCFLHVECTFMLYGTDITPAARDNCSPLPATPFCIYLGFKGKVRPMWGQWLHFELETFSWGLGTANRNSSEFRSMWKVFRRSKYHTPGTQRCIVCSGKKESVQINEDMSQIYALELADNKGQMGRKSNGTAQ